jgi:hypothetical protein
MYQPIQFKTMNPPVRYFTSRSLLRRGFLFISLVLACFALSAPAQAQLPNIFAADNPSGSVNSGGANIAYLQNTTGSNVTLTLDGTTITTKANRLNIFDRSSGVWVLRVIQDQQSQPVSPASQVTSNTFLTGLYAYYKLDEAANATAVDASVNARSLASGSTVGSVAGVINTARSFDGSGNAVLSRSASSADFSPGANHFFTTFWVKLTTLSQITDTALLGKISFPSDAEWLVYYRSDTHKIRVGATTNSTNLVFAESTTALANTTDWYFVAAGWDGTNLKVSVNGAAYATTAFAGPVFSGTGIKFNVAAEGGSNNLNGNLDEMAIWIGRNDLTISEVRQLYNNGAGLPFSSFH